MRKLEYHRDGGSEEHLRDVRAMLDQLGDALDRSALDAWIATLGLEPVWHGVTRSA